MKKTIKHFSSIKSENNKIVVTKTFDVNFCCYGIFKTDNFFKKHLNRILYLLNYYNSNNIKHSLSYPLDKNYYLHLNLNNKPMEVSINEFRKIERLSDEEKICYNKNKYLGEDNREFIDVAEFDGSGVLLSPKLLVEYNKLNEENKDKFLLDLKNRAFLGKKLSKAVFLDYCNEVVKDFKSTIIKDFKFNVYYAVGNDYVSYFIDEELLDLNYYNNILINYWNNVENN